MSKNKKEEKMLELVEEKETQIEEQRALEPKKSAAPSRRIMKRIMSFDVYFHSLMRKNSKIQPHHKAPMRNYAESQDLKEGTEDQFDRVFRLY